jgi:cytochrome c oxidase cbb3-type subunit 3
MRNSPEYENESRRGRKRMMRIICTHFFTMVLLWISLLTFTSATFANDKDDTTPSLEKGVDVYVKRCSLCHGSQGMGEGKIPLKIPNYPNTSLVKALKAKTAKEIHDMIVYGGMLDDVSKYMPPMGNELTWTQIESVSMFIQDLRTNTEETLLLVTKYQNGNSVGANNLGKQVYEARCVLCHGKDGLGDGRMARIIKNPPPFNLTLSGVPKFYLIDIISKGGEAMGRSPQMPPWSDQLATNEIEAVVDYIVTLRKDK